MAGEAMISWRDTIESPHDHFRYHIHSNGTGEVGASAAGTLGFRSYVHEWLCLQSRIRSRSPHTYYAAAHCCGCSHPSLYFVLRLVLLKEKIPLPRTPPAIIFSQRVSIWYLTDPPWPVEEGCMVAWRQGGIEAWPLCFNGLGLSLLRG